MASDDTFLTILEDEYDADPPPSYDNIGPGPISFRECVQNGIVSGSRSHSQSQGNNHNQSRSRSAVRDTQRRMSFGIGGAGNIRTTKPSGVVSSASAFLTSTPPTANVSPVQPLAAAPTAIPESTLQIPGGGERRGRASGANGLRDRLVDGVKTVLSNVGHVVHIGGGHDEAER